MPSSIGLRPRLARRPSRSRPHAVIAAACLVLLLGGAAGLRAHATGENYVWLNVESSHLEGRFEIRLDDLRERLGLDVPSAEGSQAVSGEAAIEAYLVESAGRVHEYLRPRFKIRAGGEVVPYEFVDTSIVEAPGLGLFAQYHYRTAELVVPDRLWVRNDVLLEGDRFHRSLLCIEFDRRTGREYGAEFTALVFSRGHNEQTLDLTDVRGLLRVREFVWQGVLHIWIGIDHVLFLLALLLTAVLVRTESGWEPVGDFRAAFWNVVRIVTAFTIAHSVTLTLAALDFIRLPGRFVESVIALSIVLVALNNVFARVREGGWVLIFLFGLFHGMGFASVMGELPFRMMNLVKVVVAFNVGVELGQLAIVAVAFPVLFLARRSRFYRSVVLIAGSLSVGIVAAYWFVERALGL